MSRETRQNQHKRFASETCFANSMSKAYGFVKVKVNYAYDEMSLDLRKLCAKYRVQTQKIFGLLC